MMFHIAASRCPATIVYLSRLFNKIKATGGNCTLLNLFTKQGITSNVSVAACVLFFQTYPRQATSLMDAYHPILGLYFKSLDKSAEVGSNHQSLRYERRAFPIRRPAKSVGKRSGFPPVQLLEYSLLRTRND